MSEKNGEKVIFHEKITSWNIPDLFKGIKLQTQKLQQISSRRTFPKHDGMAENQEKRTYKSSHQMTSQLIKACGM